MKMWKRNAVIIAVVLFVGTAVYLNWSFGQQAQQTLGDDTQQTGDKVLGQPVLVDGDAQLEDDGDVLTDGATGDGSVDTAASNYFDAARLTRQQARDSALSMLQETEGDATVMAESVQALSDATMAESRIENLVLAKGYPDCIAIIGENSVSVVVQAGEEGLTDADVAKIRDIVIGETSFTQNQIKIIPAQITHESDEN